MKILVVGANGFVGRNICKKHLKLSDQVYVVCNNNRDKVPTGCIHEVVDNMVFDRTYFCIGNHTLNQQQNKKVLESLKDILIWTQSNQHVLISSVYANDTESSVYAESKRLQENLIRSLCKNHIIVRPTYLFGDDMNGESLIPRWLKQAKEQKELSILGNPNRLQDYLHIDDLVDLCIKLKPTNNPIVAATGKSYSNLEIANTIKECLPDTELVFLNTNLTSKSYSYDIKDIVSKFNWTPCRNIVDWIRYQLRNENSNL